MSAAVATAAAGNFDETKHPRADDGKFGSGGGGSGGGGDGGSSTPGKETRSGASTAKKVLNGTALHGYSHEEAHSQLARALPGGVKNVPPLKAFGYEEHYGASAGADVSASPAYYSFGSRALHLNRDVIGPQSKGLPPFGQTGDVEGTWSLARDGGHQRDVLVAHEFGHHVHGSNAGKMVRSQFAPQDKTRSVDELIRHTYAQHGRKMGTSYYSSVNHEEYFAESFAAYQHFPEHLKERDPAAHSMVRAILDSLASGHV